MVCRQVGELAGRGLSGEFTENEMLERMQTIADRAQGATGEVKDAAAALLVAMETKEGYPGDRVLEDMAAACKPFRPSG